MNLAQPEFNISEYSHSCCYFDIPVSGVACHAKWVQRRRGAIQPRPTVPTSLGSIAHFHARLASPTPSWDGLGWGYSVDVILWYGPACLCWQPSCSFVGKEGGHGYSTGLVGVAPTLWKALPDFIHQACTLLRIRHSFKNLLFCPGCGQQWDLISLLDHLLGSFLFVYWLVVLVSCGNYF